MLWLILQHHHWRRLNKVSEHLHIILVFCDSGDPIPTFSSSSASLYFLVRSLCFGFAADEETQADSGRRPVAQGLNTKGERTSGAPRRAGLEQSTAPYLRRERHSGKVDSRAFGRRC